MSAWVLPDHIADVLPSEARHIEELRRALLDTARSYGYELVMPPLLEHLESLLTGTGEALDLLTFKLVDQLSGRTMGLRADTTPQVARIDAHLLNRQGVTRLCYCGPVLHTRPDSPHATREPLQFGAEIYGHAGPEADLEALQLALDCLKAAGVSGLSVDLADARILRTLLDGLQLAPARLQAIQLALAGLYGDIGVLDEASRVFAGQPKLLAALDQLRWLASQLGEVNLTFDLADMRGYAYYTGARFSIYVPGTSDALVRGGRYDEVGAVFSRNRPAAGFSLDVRELVSVVAPRALRAAIRAPWGVDPALRAAVAALCAQGETVVGVLPGHESEVDEFHCDRQLVSSAGQWVVKSL